MTDTNKDMVALADWLKYTQGINASLAHVPEMAAHIANLKKWESIVRDTARSTSEGDRREAIAWVEYHNDENGKRRSLIWRNESRPDATTISIQPLFTAPIPSQGVVEALEKIIAIDQRLTTIKCDPAGNTMRLDAVDGACASLARAAIQSIRTGEIPRELERLKSIIRSCVHGAEIVDIGGELIGLHLPNKATEP